MSAYVGKFFTTLSSAFTDFNTATLSGAIDILVIEDDHGRRHTTPFHVRFGKLQLLKSRGIPVKIQLNGHSTNLKMLLGAAGEAYFYNPTTHPSNAAIDIDVETPQHIPLAEDRHPPYDIPIKSASEQLPSSSHIFPPDAQTRPSAPQQPQQQHNCTSTTTYTLPATDSLPSDRHFEYCSDSDVELTRAERDGTAQVAQRTHSPPVHSSQHKWTTAVSASFAQFHLEPSLAQLDSQHHRQQQQQQSQPQQPQSDTELPEEFSEALFDLPASPAPNTPRNNRTSSTLQSQNPSPSHRNGRTPAPPSMPIPSPRRNNGITSPQPNRKSDHPSPLLTLCSQQTPSPNNHAPETPVPETRQTALFDAVPTLAAITQTFNSPETQSIQVQSDPSAQSDQQVVSTAEPANQLSNGDGQHSSSLSEPQQAKPAEDAQLFLGSDAVPLEKRTTARLHIQAQTSTMLETTTTVKTTLVSQQVVEEMEHSDNLANNWDGTKAPHSHRDVLADHAPYQFTPESDIGDLKQECHDRMKSDGHEGDEVYSNQIEPRIPQVVAQLMNNNPDILESKQRQLNSVANSTTKKNVQEPLCNDDPSQSPSQTSGNHVQEANQAVDENLAPVIPMSLCGSLITEGMTLEESIRVFEEKRVTYEDFMNNPEIIYNPWLLFRIGNRFVDFKVAAPYIFSALSFSRSAGLENFIHLGANKRKDIPDAPKPPPPTPARRFRWFSWSGTAVEETTTQVVDGSGEESPRSDIEERNESASTDRETEVREPASSSSTEEKDEPNDVPVSEKSDQNSDQGKGVVPNGMKPTEERANESCTDIVEKDQNNAERTDDEQASASQDLNNSTSYLSGTSYVSFSDIDPEALSLRPTTEQLMELDLKPGPNSIRFVVESSSVELSCRIFLWGCHSKIVISDVDGTITRSDVLGHLLPAVGRDWSQDGVAGLYSQIEKNGYKILYLTARPIGQASQTRAFLHSVTQGGAKLPNGPVLMSPNRLVESFAREVIRRRPHEFKIAALREIRTLFSPDYNPFHAGFGNRETDVISYRAVGLIPQRIFVVNTRGELAVMKARYESTSSYSSLHDLVENVFPDISGRTCFEMIRAITDTATFNDWNWWKASLPEIDYDALLGITAVARSYKNRYISDISEFGWVFTKLRP